MENFTIRLPYGETTTIRDIFSNPKNWDGMDSPEDWQTWEDAHGDFNRLYYDRLDELAEKINGYSFTYAEHSKHGYCI